MVTLVNVMIDLGAPCVSNKSAAGIATHKASGI